METKGKCAKRIWTPSYPSLCMWTFLTQWLNTACWDSWPPRSCPPPSSILTESRLQAGAPPVADGAVGLTQYVQVVTAAYQVFDKKTGASVLGPNALATIWAGFGGACQNNAGVAPFVLYDRVANRWFISEFAGTSIPTDVCIAVSTTSDATGTWNRYAFHLGANFFYDPRPSVWPDGYYMSMNVSNASGTAFLGPQAFAFDRAKMLDGLPATFITPGIIGGPNENPFLPADLDGSILPPSGAPNSFVEFPGAGVYKIWHFHVDFTTPANSTFTLFASPPAAPFTLLCPGTRRLCAPVRHRSQTRWRWQPLDVPPGLSEFWQPLCA